jgi:predicted AAA+ superfamily ATPase
MLLGYRDAEKGHILENIVFLELLRRGYKIHIGKFLDFIARQKFYRLLRWNKNQECDRFFAGVGLNNSKTAYHKIL